MPRLSAATSASSPGSERCKHAAGPAVLWFSIADAPTRRLAVCLGIPPFVKPDARWTDSPPVKPFLVLVAYIDVQHSGSRHLSTTGDCEIVAQDIADLQDRLLNSLAPAGDGTSTVRSFMNAWLNLTKISVGFAVEDKGCRRQQA